MRNLLKPVILLQLLLPLLLSTFAFDAVAQTVKKKNGPASRRDSLRTIQRKAAMRSFKHTGNANLDELLGKIENYTALYTQTNSDLSKGFDTLDISQRLPTLENRMKLMKKTIDNTGTLGYLVTIRNMVDHISDQTDNWGDLLSKYSSQLDDIHTDIVKFKADTALHNAPDDEMLLDKYAFQVQELEGKWQRLDSCAKKAIVKIGSLQNRVSSLAIIMIDLDDKVDIKMSQLTDKSIENEYGFIWNMHKQASPTDSAFVKTYNLNYKLAKYFFTGKTNYWPHLASLALLLVFFAWIFNSTRKIKRIKAAEARSVFSQTHYVVKHPYIATLAIVCIISPYFYDHPAQIFIQIMLIGALGCIGILIKHDWPKPLHQFWMFLFPLVIIFSISNLFIEITHFDRIVLLLSSAIAIYATFRFIKYIKPKPDAYPPYMEIILKIFIALHAISIILNILGRFSIAKIVGCTAVFNLSAGMGMYLLVQILMESLFLQLEGNKSENQELTSYLDFKVLQKKFKDAVIKGVAVLWLVALAKNLIIDDYLYDVISEFLKHPYKFSSTAFTFGSALIFIIIIWLSGIVARVISYFYDFSAQQTKLTAQAKKTRSSILLIRLTVFVVGFFVAINAAGIPMSQVTIVIGALGVGIGFGLQNIVNNLVSGVILAFEKPIQVGDVVEVAGKTGTISEIGIRASKITIGNGSELIVPNGDLISQHVVNWTLTNNNRQVELTVGVAYGTDVDKARELLLDIVNNHEDIMKAPAPAVLLNKFGENSIDYTVQFWAEDIGKAASLKSKVLGQIYTEFAKNKIEIPHPKRDINLNLPEGYRLMQQNKEAAATAAASETPTKDDSEEIA